MQSPPAEEIGLQLNRAIFKLLEATKRAHEWETERLLALLDLAKLARAERSICGQNL